MPARRHAVDPRDFLRGLAQLLAAPPSVARAFEPAPDRADHLRRGRIDSDQQRRLLEDLRPSLWPIRGPRVEPETLMDALPVHRQVLPYDDPAAGFSGTAPGEILTPRESDALDERFRRRLLERIFEALGERS